VGGSSQVSSGPAPPQIDLQVLSKIKANGFYIASVVLSLVTTAVCITLLSQITSRALEDEITYAPLMRPAVLVAPCVRRAKPQGDILP
jgi:hypothetical protein